MNIDLWLLARGTAIASQSRAWWRLPASRRRLEILAAEYFERAREAKRVTKMLDEIVADAQDQVFRAQYEAYVELDPIEQSKNPAALEALQRAIGNWRR